MTHQFPLIRFLFHLQTALHPIKYPRLTSPTDLHLTCHIYLQLAYRSTPKLPDISSTPARLLQSLCSFLFTHLPKSSIFRRVLRGISYSSPLRLLFSSLDGRASLTFFYSSGASPPLICRSLPSVSMFHWRQGVAIDGEELDHIFHLMDLVSSLMFINILLSPVSTNPVCIINSKSRRLWSLSPWVSPL